MDPLCTYAQVRDEAKLYGTTAESLAAKQWIINNIMHLSARVEVMTRQRYVPYYKEEFYDAFGPHIDDTLRMLDLRRPILLPTRLIDAFDNELTFNTDYVFVQRDSPANQLQLITPRVYGWSYGFGFGTYFWIAPGQFLRKIRVWGIWGSGMDYPSQWINSLQTIATVGGINDTVNTFTVADVNGFNEWAYTPALSVGNTIQLINNNVDPAVYEWMRVLAIDETTNTVTVLRGINGSTKQAWPAGQEIFTWNVTEEINRAAYRWLGYWYSRRGDYETYKSDLSQGKTIKYPADAPTEILNIMAQTRDWGWEAV